MQQQSIVSSMADETGHIEIDDPTPGVVEPNLRLDIRDDTLQMFETIAGDLLLRTDDMPSGTFVKAVPTSEGVVPEIAVREDTDSLQQLEPAAPAEQPDVTRSIRVEQRVD